MEYRQQSYDDRKVFLGNLAYQTKRDLLHWLDANGWTITNRSKFHLVPKGGLVHIVRASGRVAVLRFELNKTSEGRQGVRGRVAGAPWEPERPEMGLRLSSPFWIMGVPIPKPC